MDTESAKETVKPSRGECRSDGFDLWRLRSCASSICTRGRGCWLKHPAFSAPSFDFEGGCWQNSGAIVPRERGLLPQTQSTAQNRNLRGRNRRPLAVNLVRAFLERRRKPFEGRIEHRTHQGCQRPALELIRDKETDVAVGVALRLEGPTFFETGNRTFQIANSDFQIRTVKRYFAGEGLLHYLERYRHVGHHDLGPVCHRPALTDLQRLAQRHELRITLDIGNEVEHLRGAVKDPALAGKPWHVQSARDRCSRRPEFPKMLACVMRRAGQGARRNHQEPLG